MNTFGRLHMVMGQSAYVGINIGAVTVKVACLGPRGRWSRVVPHQGRPLETLDRLQQQLPADASDAYFGVSGHLGHISEAAATEAALQHIGQPFDAVASLGGEAFIVYLLDGWRIASVLSHNKCAAGSGQFLVQQVGRLGLDLATAIRRSQAGKVVPLASRCSVHCKSDITHKINRHEATTEDILHTLHDSMANKVVTLVEKGQRPVRRLLVVGGLAQNDALLAALRAKLPGTQIVVRPESLYFEALGTAVLVRQSPRYRRPKLAPTPTLATLPPLAAHDQQVKVIAPSRQADPSPGPLVLGVDAGSTTTKAVLLDAATGQLVASHYGRTNGDPLRATQACLRALIGQVGNRQVALTATTGSARELIGAYLDTPHIYNEISAHAAGAASVDPEVDTIFEIGGQDSKYIYLRNGVAVDYAMNAACSAGTGSFLEECAQGDLGLPLQQIAETALRARAPVQFKATCAAFINSDIRAALQQGCRPEDVTAGLVYSIVQNYLTTVKGRRPVGKKVFLQGGVALNRAVGYAFAQCLGKPVVIPPHPELLGAMGVALLAIQRCGRLAEGGVQLRRLAQRQMQTLDPFTCRACTNHCRIDRFRVAGHKFPFGGRCSRFENVRKGKGRQVAGQKDLIAARNRLILDHCQDGGPAGGRKIGIPRALTTHALFPLYATFFQRLGMQVVLSSIDPAGWAKANAAFCFPVQIAHGAVLDLVKRGVKTIFLPHVNRMPNAAAGRDSFLCPVTQASPYVVAKAFPDVAFLSPVLNFAAGYESSDELVRMAVEQLGVPQPEAEAAWRAAIEVQQQTEAELRRLGQRALDEALCDDRPTIILVGRSYNAFPPEASQSVARKLASMGVRVIPGDCLPPAEPGPTSWHYPNTIISAAELAKRHPNLFLVYVSNFSCTIDAFTHVLLASRLGDRPYLHLEIDAHTGDAGVQTRLEAFLDVVEHYRRRAGRSRRFRAASIDAAGRVTASDGRQLQLRDPQVKLYFPAFSYYHSRAFALAARWQGLHVGGMIDLDRRHLEIGLRYTSGRECLPLPITVGQMLEAHSRRRPGEVVGFYMLRGGAPCVVDCYLSYFQQLIKQQQLADLFLFDPQPDNRFYGLNVWSLAQVLAPVITLADIFVEMEQTLHVVGRGDAAERLRQLWDQHLSEAPSLRELRRQLPLLADRIAAIEHDDPSRCPKVLVTGDFFTRFDPFFMEGVRERYAQHGIILVPVDLSELFLYAAYSAMVRAAGDLGAEADSPWAAARACLNLLRPEGKSYLANWVKYRQLTYYEDRYRRIFQPTGLLVDRPNNISEVFRHAAEHISPVVYGEAIPTVGKAVAAAGEGYHGIIVVGPFNCLPLRISEAILKPFCVRERIPILSYESDGFAVPPAFLRQVEVHIQRVLSSGKSAAESAAGESERWHWPSRWSLPAQLPWSRWLRHAPPAVGSYNREDR